MDAKPFFRILVVILLMGQLQTVSFGTTNTIPWSDNFESYTNLTPLIDGTNGWFASSASAVVQTNVYYTGSRAVMLPIDVTLSNRFSNSLSRIVKLEMQVQPQLYTGATGPAVATNVAAQFYINSNGYFVVCNGTNWQAAPSLWGGGSATRVTNTHFTKVVVNLRYRNHTWNLKAWSNTTLVASTRYINFTSNLNAFNGFDIYNGNSTSYVDDVTVTNVTRINKINGVRVDAIYRVNDVRPELRINGVADE